MTAGNESSEDGPRRPRALIIGAGPAGLTAALELLGRSDLTPVVIEESDAFGGLSRTVNHNGNRIDIGGHRFFSKSDRVMAWWQDILPVMGAPTRDDRVLGREVALSELPNAPDPEQTDRVMLVRRRLSRILFLGKFFDYPITLSLGTLLNLGLPRVLRILASYVRARLAAVRPEVSLEDFFVNRFGRELYETFFRDYTEKVWGVPCRELPAEWGAQRVKGLSVFRALVHAARRQLTRREGIAQRGTETSLIEQFLYPKLGPGQLWEAVAAAVRDGGGEIVLGHKVTAVHCRDDRVIGVTATDLRSGETARFDADAVFSSMPVRDLLAAFDPPVAGRAREVADGLAYRDFITVGLLLRRLKIRGSLPSESGWPLLPDNWIYVQEPHVRLGRVQVYNNWSPYLVADPSLVWLGLEYFCTEGDDLWRLGDAEMAAFAAGELAAIGFIEPDAILDSVVVRVPKAYPAYFGTYGDFAQIREHTDPIANLFLIGRNGMHRYNNMDHSMLTAITAVDLYQRGGGSDKTAIWSVNAESDYHEARRS